MNLQLFEKKIEYLQAQRSQNNQTFYQLSFRFHEIEISFHSDNQDFIKELKEYIPSDWLTKTNPTAQSIFHFDVAHWSEAEPYDNEKSSLTHFHQGYIIQRDFIAHYEKGSQTTYTAFEAKLDDGLHNFFRWYLSPQLLPLNKAMIHSSAILSKDEREAFLFFGPSGAGKTTITELASPRKILSDDMNVLHIENGQLFCSPGGVGGLYKPQVSLDRKYPVKSIFWLIQSDLYSTEKVAQIHQYKYLLATFANLPLGNIDITLEEQILAFADRITHLKEIENLYFPKRKDIWNQLNPN